MKTKVKYCPNRGGYHLSDLLLTVPKDLFTALTGIRGTFDTTFIEIRPVKLEPEFLILLPEYRQPIKEQQGSLLLKECQCYTHCRELIYWFTIDGYEPEILCQDSFERVTGIALRKDEEHKIHVMPIDQGIRITVGEKI